MSNDLEANMVSKLTGDGHTKLAQGMSKVTENTKKANAAAKDLQRSAYQCFQTLNAQTEKAAAGTNKLHVALSRVGGPAGSLLSKLVGGTGLGTGLAFLSTGALAAGAAFRIFTASIERSVHAAQMGIDAHKELKKAIEAGEAVVAGQSKAGTAQAGDVRSVLAAGGQEAYRAATQLAENNTVGITSSEAFKGTSTIYGQLGPGAMSQNASKVAYSLAKAGIPYGQAADIAVKAGPSLGSTSGMEQFAATEFAKLTGYHGTDPVGRFREAQSSTETRFLNETGRATSIRNRIDRQERDVATSRAVSDAKTELASALDPIGKAFDDLQKQRSAAIGELDKLAEAEGNLGRVLADFRGVFGGEGSKKTQKGRLLDSYNAGGTE